MPPAMTQSHAEANTGKNDAMISITEESEFRRSFAKDCAAVKPKVRKKREIFTFRILHRARFCVKIK